jgi:hypothetical protein
VHVVLVSSAVGGQAGGGESRVVQMVPGISAAKGKQAGGRRQGVASGVRCGLCWSAVL